MIGAQLDRLVSLDASLAGCLRLVLLVAVVALIASSVKQYLRLRNFDGPLLGKFSRLWMLAIALGDESHLRLYEVIQKYGSIARIGSNMLLTSDPDLLRHMTSVRSGYSRAYFYYGFRFDPTKDNLLSLVDEHDHTALRAKVAAGYSGRQVEGVEDKIDENITRFTDLLGKYADQGVMVDFGRKTQYLTLDVISDIAFGFPFGHIESDSDVFKYIVTTQKALKVTMVTVVFPILIKIFALPLLRSAVPSDKDPFGFGRLLSIAKDVAAERYGPDKKVQQDMLGSFVRHGLTQTEAESEILLQVIAGSDTTAGAIRSTLFHVVASPRVLSKLRREIDDMHLGDAVITNADAQKMPYLQAVIKEGLRIFPPAASLFPKQVPPEGDQWNGIHLPGGTQIGFSIWGVCRREEIWGKHSSEFRPERWLECSPDKLREMESAVELIFGYGRWQCLGRAIALMELNKIFVQLLRHFDFSVGNLLNPWQVVNTGTFAQKNFLLRVERRQE